MTLNQRRHPRPAEPLRRKVSVLEQFPDEKLEAVVVQWEGLSPTVLVQMLRHPGEPVQFPGKRPEVPGNAELNADLPSALDLPLLDFLDPTTNHVFAGEAYNADLLFSQRAFAYLQPEPDLVLPEQAMWECRAEALDALGIEEKNSLENPS